MTTNGESSYKPYLETPRPRPLSGHVTTSDDECNGSTDCCGHDLGQETKTPNQDITVDSWSPTQLIWSLTMLLLVERGSLDVNAKVSQYWSQCVSEGERDLKLGNSFTHTPCGCGRDDSVMIEEVSEMVRRVDGRSLTQLITEGMSGALRRNFPPPRSVVLARECEACFSSSSSPLHLATQHAGPADAQPDHTSNTATQNHQTLLLPTKLYPATIPPHLHHPSTHDFSVIDQDPVGKALVTHRRWQKGTFMARFDGITVPEVMLHTLQKNPQVHLWDPYFIGVLAHSCSPSVSLDMDEHRMWAVRDIEPGTVLSMDYASTEDVLFRTFQCRCDAVDCRGEITGRSGRGG